MESAIKLVERFIAGVTKPAPPPRKPQLSTLNLQLRKWRPNRLIIELKAAKALADEPVAQILGYLRSSRRLRRFNAETQRVPARQSRNEAGTTDRKIAGQKNGMPVYLYVPHFSVSRYSIGFPRSLRVISTIAVQRPAETSFSLRSSATSNTQHPTSEAQKRFMAEEPQASGLDKLV
jgi:hypothetical protein